MNDDEFKERMKAGIIKNGENINEVIGKIEQLTETIDNTLQLVDQKGELLFECEIGDEYHQMILEVGLNKILKDAVEQWEKNHFWNINQKLTEFKTEKKE
jgi:hypothetical protein